MQAHNLRQVDKDLELHKAAWLNVQAGAMKQQGRNKQVPVYKRFKDFFDYEQAVKDAKGIKEPSKFDGLSKHLKEKQNG